MELTAAQYKNAGNKLCISHRYDEAAGFYSKAIDVGPSEPSFYSNRALCYLKLKQYPQAVQDCRRALELDPNWLKAHFFLGMALNESGNHDEALKHLQRAHDLAREGRLNYGDDITYQIRLAKRRQWTNIDEESAQLDNELHDYLVGLIKRDKQRRKEVGKFPSDENINSGTTSDDGASEAQSTAGSVPRDEGDKLEMATDSQKVAGTNPDSKCDIYMNRLETIFNQLKLQRMKREVPDQLCGKISYEIMRDPVITPSGITYDRKNIEEHLYRVGFFDPITRQPLTVNQLVPNMAMKEVIDAYLAENEWANYC